MPAGQYNFTIEQGATFSRSFSWQRRDGTPISIDGYSARMQIRATSEATSPALVTLSTGSEGGIELVDPNIIVVTITASQTAALKFDKALYDLKVTSPSGDVVRLIEGRVTLSPAITR